MTFRRSLRMIAKRWWLLVLGGVVFAALAFVVAAQRKDHYVADTSLTLGDVVVQANPYGQGIVINPATPRFTSDWTTDGFYDARAANTTAAALGGSPSASSILANITAIPVSTTAVKLTYDGASNQAKAIEVLRRYATALINNRVKQQEAQLAQAHVSLENQIASAPPGTSIHRLKRNAAQVLQQQGTLPSTFATGFESDPTGHAVQVSAGGPPAALIVVGGF